MFGTDTCVHRAGDDCVSVQTGCSNILVHNVNCGPGHGISIGSLGKQNTKACVSNVTVRDVTIQNTLTGVRIKTWQVNFTKHSYDTCQITWTIFLKKVFSLHYLNQCLTLVQYTFTTLVCFIH